MTEHAVVIAGAGPTGLMLAGELALAGVPMAVTYRVNAISAAMARRLIRVPHVAMVNLLAERELVPELLQADCTPETLSRTTLRLLRDPDAGQAQRDAFRTLLDTLRPPEGTPSEAAARQVLQVLDQPRGDGLVA